MTTSYRFLPAPFRVGLVVFPGCMPAGLFATADVLRGANARSGREEFRVDWVSATRAPVPVWGGQSLQPTGRLSDGHDALLVPGIWATSARELSAVLEQRPLIDALGARPRATALWSYCAGVALVAAAGRLDGRAATATWWMQPFLEARYPRVRWSFAEPLVRGGDVVTASGPHGYLAVVGEQLRHHLDPSARRDVLELLMVPQPRNLHPLFRGLEVMSVDEELRPVLSYALKTAAAALDLRGAATSAGLSQRTLCRRIRLHTGASAGAWLRRVKLKQAADALMRTSKSVKEISLGLGFSSEAGFHRAFRRTVGQTALAFRHEYGERPVRARGAGLKPLPATAGRGRPQAG